MSARHDGEPSRTHMNRLRRMLPFLMPTRNEAWVLFSQEIAAAPTRELTAELARTRPAERPATPFHLLLCAIARTLHEYPRLNRLLAGERHYDRRGVWLAFSGKQRLDADAPVFSRKMEFREGEPVQHAIDRIYELLEFGRSGRDSASDREVDVLLRLPGPLLRLAVRSARWLDGAGLLPRAMTEDDPLYASAFVTNLGSVGLDACYHHLFEHGNAPIFVTMGRVHRAPFVEDDGRVTSREVFELKYTFDERTEDGFYAARGIEHLKRLLESPRDMLAPGDLAGASTGANAASPRAAGSASGA
ncbi:MAG: 2-oxo acid dehydrogenase subunit E2 [Alphaproteobacteria bacterium]